jgi:hypothetical protein
MLLSALLLLGAAPAFASPGPSSQSLTPELQAKVRATHARFANQMKPLWQGARATRQALAS